MSNIRDIIREEVNAYVAELNEKLSTQKTGEEDGIETHKVTDDGETVGYAKTGKNVMVGRISPKKKPAGDVEEGKMTRLAAGLGLGAAALAGGAKDAQAQQARPDSSAIVQRAGDMAGRAFSANLPASDAEKMQGTAPHRNRQADSTAFVNKVKTDFAQRMRTPPNDSVATGQSRDMQRAVTSAADVLRSRGILPQHGNKRTVTKNPDGTYTATVDYRKQPQMDERNIDQMTGPELKTGTSGAQAAIAANVKKGDIGAAMDAAKLKHALKRQMAKKYAAFHEGSASEPWSGYAAMVNRKDTEGDETDTAPAKPKTKKLKTGKSIEALARERGDQIEMFEGAYTLEEWANILHERMEEDDYEEYDALPTRGKMSGGKGKGEEKGRPVNNNMATLKRVAAELNRHRKMGRLSEVEK